MDPEKKWEMFLNSGNFLRKVKKYRLNDINKSIDNLDLSTHCTEKNDKVKFKNLAKDPELESSIRLTSDPNCNEPSGLPSPMEFEIEPDPESHPYPNIELNCSSYKDPINTDPSECLSTFLQNWSLQFNIRQQALKPLLQKLNQMDHTLPTDPSYDVVLIWLKKLKLAT